MPDIFNASVVKFNFWICKSSVNDCYCVSVKVYPTFVTACSSSPKQTSFNFLAA
jgi:hypothetical protein